jgi:WD40 repeat protein
MKNIRIYEAKTMEWIKDIQCVAVILALEYCSSKNALAASLSDRTIVFFDTQNPNNKIVKRMHVPSTQKCLTYVERPNGLGQKQAVLFSAGVDGAIFAWNLDRLFSNDFAEQQKALKMQLAREKSGGQVTTQEKTMDAKKRNAEDKKEYIMYIAEKTPWFVGEIILCICYLDNMNKLASGSYDRLIRLWDLDD